MVVSKLKSLKFRDEIQKRVISAGVLAPIVLLIIYFGGVYFNSLIILVSVIMAFEWHNIINSAATDDTDILEELPLKRWELYGAAYITIFASSLVYLRSLEDGGGVVFLMLLMVWATDIAAFFTGRYFKGPKIWTRISPKKTWSGLIGGILASALIGIIFSFFGNLSLSSMILLGIFVAIVAQAGDFFESYVKRRFGVKDSGSIIPGHGGLLDRLDGFTTTAPFFVIFVNLNGSIF